MQGQFDQVRKRDGRLVAFDRTRIANAVARAMAACGEGDPEADGNRVAEAVITALSRRFPAGHIPQVEEIQDIVEETLILMEFAKTAKAYILYRHERALVREKAAAVPDEVVRLTA
ncbi:MAG: ATP cone domain-containing protein [Deltaproteobacteria bacterium]